MYGYIKKDGKLMVDETQADFVRELFEMYATGKFSMKQMEKHFYQKGIRNSKGKMLSHSTMSNIIRNPKYRLLCRKQGANYRPVHQKAKVFARGRMGYV